MLNVRQLMEITLQKMKTQARRLKPRQRVQLAHFLLSLEPDEDDAVAEAWKKEIARRVQEIRSGKAVGKRAEQVFAELREQRR